MNNASRRLDSILFLSKLGEQEHPEVFVKALELLHEEGVTFMAVMVGDPSDPAAIFAHKLRNRAATLALEGVLSMRDGVPTVQVPELFDEHAICVHVSPTGVPETIIREASRAGTLLVTSDEKLRAVLPDILIVDPDSTESVAAGIKAALGMNEEDRDDVIERLRAK